MTLRPSLPTPSPVAEPIDPITASRLAHAASREVSGNLFRLLVDLSSNAQSDPAQLSHKDSSDPGPPWDEGHVVTTAAKVAASNVSPVDG